MLSEWSTRRDVALALGVAAALLVNLALGLAVGDDRDVTTVTWLLTAAAPLPLVLRTTAPIVALYATVGLLIVYLATGNPVAPIPVASAIALYSVAASRERRTVIVVLATIPAIAGAASLVIDEDEPPVSSRIAVVSTLLLIVVLGDAVRSRRSLAAAYEEQLHLTRSMQEADAERRVGAERRRIARDVHDVVAHSISTINVRSGVAAHLAADDTATREALEEIRDTSRMALAELRATLGVLRDDVPAEPSPGLDALPALIEGAPGPVEFEITDETAAGNDEPVDAVVQVAVYRLVQEALTNAHRHAPGEMATVRIDVGNTVGVHVRNAMPPGGAGRSPGSGYGVVGMRERVDSLGGELRVGERLDGMFVVDATLPRSVVPSQSEMP